jgi:hypothetical protein
VAAVRTPQAQPRPHGAVPAARRPAGEALLLLACFVLAALSLVGPDAPTYDPWAWLNWGRQLSEGGLDTTAGPSWKPLPVVFTTAFGFLGDDAAPPLWLLVARTGGLVALALAYRLAARLAGPAAGLVAVVALALSNGFVSSFARGNSEGLLVAFALAAIERHLDGRPRQAFLLGAAAGLLRPEVWPFLAVYGVWLVVVARRDGRARGAVALVAGAGIVTALLWFVPDWIATGSPWRAAERARDPVAGSPGQASRPFLAVFENSASALLVPVYAGAVAAVVLAGAAWRRARGGGAVLAMAVVASAYMVIVALLAEAGATGNLRYVTLPAAILCVLTGVGFAGLVRAAGRRWAVAAAVAVVASLPWIVAGLDALGDDLDEMRTTARVSDDISRVLEATGGTDAVRRCEPVFTGPLEVQLVAWHLGVPNRRIGINPEPPGSVLALRGTADAEDPRFRPVAQSEYWTLRRTCP